jgi:hypothetical protein
MQRRSTQQHNVIVIAHTNQLTNLVYSPAIDPQHRFRQFVGEQVTSPGVTHSRNSNLTASPFFG